MAVGGTKLYISDWYNGTISLYSALRDSVEMIVSVSVGVGQPVALFYSATTLLTHNGHSHYALRRPHTHMSNVLFYM